MSSSPQQPLAITARRWLELAHDVDDLLVRERNGEKLLAGVAQSIVARVADKCIVDLLEGARLRRVEMTASDPMWQLSVEEAKRRYAPRKGNPIWRVVKTGEPALVETVSRSHLERIAVDPLHLSILLERGPRSYLTVPLKSNGSPFGAITFLVSTSNRRYGRKDVPFALDIAEKIAETVRPAAATATRASGFRYRARSTADQRSAVGPRSNKR